MQIGQGLARGGGLLFAVDDLVACLDDGPDAVDVEPCFAHQQTNGRACRGGFRAQLGGGPGELTAGCFLRPELVVDLAGDDGVGCCAHGQGDVFQDKLQQLQSDQSAWEEKKTEYFKKIDERVERMHKRTLEGLDDEMISTDNKAAYIRQRLTSLLNI